MHARAAGRGGVGSVGGGSFAWAWACENKKVHVVHKTRRKGAGASARGELNNIGTSSGHHREIIGDMYRAAMRRGAVGGAVAARVDGVLDGSGVDGCI